MLRLALIPFAVVVALLVLLAVLPSAATVVPSAAVELQDVAVTLYPRSDPEAVWHFATPRADYVPASQEATLHSVEDGRRTVAGETDFTLHSQRVTIDRSENLRGDEMRAHLVEDELDLVMLSRAGRQVLIDQRNGRFEVPRAIMSGPDLGESVFEDMRISFDFTDFESGGPGTVGYAQFMVDLNEEN
ncbi:MAG: hypothetical protein WDA03_06630 [Trueperaceae bacterium]